jgi:transposase
MCIDVHRKRSQVAVVTGEGAVELNKNVVNGSEPFLRLIGDLPSGTPVAFEAAFGWSWLADLLEDYGFEAHLVHPLRCKAIASARLKNDKAGAAILAQLLRADLLPEAWIAPAKVRQLRALIRHRISAVRLGTGLRNRIHAGAAGHGYDAAISRRREKKIAWRHRRTPAQAAGATGGFRSVAAHPAAAGSPSAPRRGGSSRGTSRFQRG